jgi:hypothetical protein
VLAETLTVDVLPALGLLGVHPEQQRERVGEYRVGGAIDGEEEANEPRTVSDRTSTSPRGTTGPSGSAPGSG